VCPSRGYAAKLAGEQRRTTAASCAATSKPRWGTVALTDISGIKPGLTFHGLRHSHKTWMIADGIPEIAQSRRLGHILHDKIQETYSHVATEVEHRLLQSLQDRWEKAVANSPTVTGSSAWRAGTPTTD
jgi:integrase